MIDVFLTNSYIEALIGICARNSIHYPEFEFNSQNGKTVCVCNVEKEVFTSPPLRNKKESKNFVSKIAYEYIKREYGLGRKM